MSDQNTLKMNNKSSKGIPVSKIPTSGRDSGTHSRSSSVSNLTTASDVHSEAGDAASENIHDFKSGEKVWVNGTKPGCIKFIGKTQFAPGIWAGILLDEPVGKNDGSVAGVKYFECEPLRGIFARPNKLTRSPGTVPGIGDSSNTPLTSSKLGASLPSSKASVCSSVASTPRGTCSKLRVGERVVVSSTTGTKTGTLRFVGETEFAKGEWAGIELDEPVGKNDGSVAGKRYFSCQMKYGLFSPLHKVSRAGGMSTSRSASVRGTPLMRSGSRDSLSSSVSNSSRASRVKLGITSLTNSQRSRVPGSGLMINTSGLEEALKEKELHIEQLLKERENERSEVARVASRCEEIETKFSEQKDLLEKTNLLRKSLEDELTTLKRKYEDIQFQFEEEKVVKSEFEMQLSKRNAVLHRLEEFVSKNVSNKFVPIKEILEGQEELSEVSVREESNQITEELKGKVTELENSLKNMLEEKDKISIERDEFQRHLSDVELKHKNLLTGFNELDLAVQEKDNLIANLKEELNSQLEKVTKLMDANKALNEQVIMQAELAKGQADDVIKELGEKVNLLTEDIKVKSSLLEEKGGLIQDKDSTISILQQKLESQATIVTNLDCENKNLNQVLGQKDSELSEKTAMQKCLEDTIASLKSELEIAKNEEKMLGLVKEIERLTNCLQEKEDELIQQQNKVSALQIADDELNKELMQLKEKLQEAENNLSLSSKSNSDENEALQTQLTQLKEEKDHIKDEYEKKLQSAQDEVKSVIAELKEKNNLLSTKESEFVSLTEKFNAKDLECAGLEKICKEKEDSINLLKVKEQFASDLKEETEKLKAQLDEKNNEANDVKRELNSLKETLNLKTEENKQLLSKLELAEQKIAMLNKDSSDHVMSLQNELTKVEEEGMVARSLMEQELTKLKNENEKLSTVITENAEKLKEKETILSSSVNKLNGKDSEIAGLSNKIKQLEKEVTALNEDKDNGKIAHQKDLENMTAKYASELKEKELELETVHAELKGYAELTEKNNQDLKQKESDIAALKNMVNEKEMQFDELSKMIEASQAQLMQLKENNEGNIALLNSKESYIKDFKADQEKQLQQKEQLFKDEVAKLQDIMNVKEAEIKKQENMILNLSSQEEKRKEQVRSLESELENMKLEQERKVNEFNDVCTEFNNKIAGMEEKYSKILLEKEEIAKEELKSRDAKKKLEAMRDTLLKEKSDQEEIVKDRETKLEALQAEVNRMRLEFTQHKQELQQKLDVSEMEVQATLELKNQLEVQHSVLEELQQELQNSEEKCKNLELQVQNLSSVTSERNELQSKIEAFEKLNHSISERTNEIEKKNQILEEQLSNNKNILMQKELDITSLNEQLQVLQKFENSSESLKLAMDSVEKENASLKKKIASLEATSVEQNANVTVGDNANDIGDDEEKESLKSQIDFLNSIIVDMKQKNEDLSKQLEIATTCWDEPAVNLNGTKKKLAPRMFCDICDMFDLHDTDDCPKQESYLEEEVPNLRPSGPRKFEERPYCNNCECFGHWTLDCKEPETF